MIRDQLRIPLQHLTGHTGDFSREFELFWADVQKKYACVNCPSEIPWQVIPLWLEIAKQKGVPIAEEPVKKPAKAKVA